MNKTIRDLLADCRIELRTLMRDFHKSELCRRIDEARVELSRDEAPASAMTAVAASSTAAASTDSIAQAWRLAAEDLRVTAPAIYQLLAKKVAQRLAAAATQANEPVAEDVVETPVPAPEAETMTATDVARDPEAADASAVEVVPEPAPEVAVVEPIVEAVPANPLAPSRDDLLSISRHKRRFTEAQREWCVGEALIRSGFTINPNDFIGGGDHAMALYLLETEPGAA